MTASKEIICKTIKVSNIEVVENDFPKTMFWDDAKIAYTEIPNLHWLRITCIKLISPHMIYIQT